MRRGFKIALGLSTVLVLFAVLTIFYPILFYALPPSISEPLYANTYGWFYPKIYRCNEGLALIDSGPVAAANRYSISFAEVLLSEDKTYEYLLDGLCGLPQQNIEFTAGLEASRDDASPHWEHWDEENAGNRFSGASAAASPDVAFEVYDRNSGEIVTKKAGNLSFDWTWSGSVRGGPLFIYGRASGKQVGYTYFENKDGTSFVANSKRSYLIRLKITPRALTPRIKALFLAEGGGWKVPQVEGGATDEQ